MLSFHIDAALLAVPNYGLSSGDAEEIIERAFAISNAIASHLPVSFVISTNLEEALWSCGCAPHHQVVNEFLEMMNLIDTFSANDVVKSYQTMIDRATRLLDMGQREVTKFSRLVVDPAIPDSLAPIALRHETERMAATTALGVHEGAISGLVPGWPGAVAGRMNIACDIEGVEPGGHLMQSKSISATVDVCPEPASLIACRMSDRIWHGALTDEELHLAIAIKALEIIRDSGEVAELSKLVDFTIGSGFRRSLEANQCIANGAYAAVCLHLCAQLVAGKCSKYKRPMGENGQIFRDRDSAGAWRIHLTEAHQALRLMYWEDGGRIEFANVGPKFQERIEEGVRGYGAQADLSALE